MSPQSSFAPRSMSKSENMHKQTRSSYITTTTCKNANERRPDEEHEVTDASQVLYYYCCVFVSKALPCQVPPSWQKPCTSEQNTVLSPGTKCSVTENQEKKKSMNTVQIQYFPATWPTFVTKIKTKHKWMQQQKSSKTYLNEVKMHQQKISKVLSHKAKHKFGTA